MTWQLLHGDCRELMAQMEGCSVDAVVTDPPYDLTSGRPGGRSPATEGKVMRGFMGMQWDGSGVAFQSATWSEALRVLKPGGHLLAFGGSRTYHRLACAIEDAGFEVRDQIMWIYGQGFPKGGNRDGKGTCLKPAHEPIVMARKPCIGSARANVAAFGTGALNIDVCRVGMGSEVVETGSGGGSAIYGGGKGLRPGIVEPVPFRSHSLGRWPANVIHDGSDEVTALFPDRPGMAVGPLRRGATTGAGMGFGGSDAHDAGVLGYGDTGSAARFFYCAKASKVDRDEGLDQFSPKAFVQFQSGNGESGQASSLSAGRETQYRNIHPTVKPEALMRYLVRLVTPVGGTVLDPFAGSGSTGKAAILEGRSFVGCELTAEYLPIAEARLCAAANRHAVEQAAAAPGPQRDLFVTEAA